MSNFIANFLNDKLKEKNNNTKSFVDENELKNKKVKDNEANNIEEKKTVVQTISIEQIAIAEQTNLGRQRTTGIQKVDKNNEKIKGNEIKKNEDDNTKKVKKYEELDDIQNIKTWVSKELTWYLWNNFNLDNTIKNMSIKEMENDLNNENSDIKTVNKSKENIIKIQKEKPYKNLLFIFIEFLIWVILIIVSVIHIDKNIAEYKFMRSSIDLWTNTFNWIVAKFNGIIWDNAREIYIKKRQDLVSDLEVYEDKLKSCDKKWKDKMKFRLINLKEQLENTNYITLDKFIKNYEEYKLDVDAIKVSIDNLCK